jgi:hypothetical protein
MKSLCCFLRPFLLFLIAFTAPGFMISSRAQIPVPSRWQGEIAGQVHNKAFRLPVTIELKKSLPHEDNPFNVFVGAGDPDQIGHVFLSSAMPFSTTRGTATLQYLDISIQGNRLQAVLTDDHRSEAAKANGFSGPNVSADEASDLMKDVLRNAWGNTEMFGFSIGTNLTINFSANQLSGMIQGAGGSYTATSSPVRYQARMEARRSQ